MIADVPAIEIVVTGRGLEAATPEGALDTLRIGPDRIEQAASQRLEDILRDAGGFQQFRRSDSRSAHPTSQGATLRGLGGNAASRARVLLDGVPLADPFGGWINWSAIDPARLALIRVTRGGGDAPGALAGTIALESHVPGTEASWMVEGVRGSRDALDLRGGGSGELGGAKLAIDARHMRGDGFIPVIASQRGTADRPAGHVQSSLAARAVTLLAESVELQANALWWDDRRDRGTAFSENHAQGFDASLRLVGQGALPWEVGAWIQSRDFASKFASVNAERSQATLTLDQHDVPATGRGARALLAPRIGRATLRIGGELRLERGETNELYLFADGQPTRAREAGGRIRTTGAFAEVGISPRDGVSLSALLRVDRWMLGEGRLVERVLATGVALRDERPADRAGTEPTARLAGELKISQALDLRGAAYLGWRMPTLNELYRPFRAGNDTTLANPGLAPERLHGLDAGLRWRPSPAIELALTLFANRLEGAIANVTLTEGPGGSQRQRANLDAIESRGVEMDARWQSGPWRLGLAYALAEAGMTASGTAIALDGLRPSQVPRHLLSLDLGWARDGRQAGLVLRHVARQPEDDLNRRWLGSALTLDAAATWPLFPGMTLLVRGENIGNRRVEAGITASGIVERATPRTLWLGVRYASR